MRLIKTAFFKKRKSICKCMATPVLVREGKRKNCTDVCSPLDLVTMYHVSKSIFLNKTKKRKQILTCSAVRSICNVKLRCFENCCNLWANSITFNHLIDMIGISIVSEVQHLDILLSSFQHCYSHWIFSATDSIISRCICITGTPFCEKTRLFRFRQCDLFVAQHDCYIWHNWPILCKFLSTKQTHLYTPKHLRFNTWMPQTWIQQL